MNAPTVSLNGLARRLVSDGLLDGDLAKQISTEAAREKVPFIHYAVKNGVLDARIIAQAASIEFGTALFDLDALAKDSIPDKLVDEKLIRKHHILPLMRRGNRLFLAVADPTDLHALDEIKFSTGISTEAVLVEADKLASAIDRYLKSLVEGIDDALAGLDDDGLDG